MDSKFKTNPSIQGPFTQLETSRTSDFDENQMADKIEPARKYLNITVKRATTFRNVLALPLVFVISTAAGGFVNTQMSFLLRDPDFFNISADNIGSAMSKIVFVSTLTSLLFSVTGGYLYDLFGRRLTLTIACVITVATILILPYTSPNYNALMIVACVCKFGHVIIGSNPLVVDYVKSDSRGKASSLQNLGFIVGEVTAMLVLVQGTKHLAVTTSFFVAAIVVSLLSFVIILFFVREPRLKNHHQKSGKFNIVMEDGREFQSLSKYEQTGYLTKRCWQVMTSDIRYLLALTGSLVVALILVLLSVYMMLWIQSFVETGDLASPQEAKDIYTMLVVFSLLGSLISIPVFGYASDKLPLKYFIPASFALRACILVSFQFITKPTGIKLALLGCGVVTASMAERISIEVLFMRKLPHDIRGAMMGVYHFFGQLGILLFSLFGGFLFDQIGPKAPFFAVACLDLLVCALAIIMTLCRRLQE